MRVEFERIPEQIKTKVTMCCDEMAKAYEFRLIGFGDINDELRPGDDINLYQHKGVEDSWFLFPINFCPFCGVQVSAEQI